MAPTGTGPCKSALSLKSEVGPMQELVALNQPRVHEKWRAIMRKAKSEDLRKEVQWLADAHNSVMQRKDALIQVWPSARGRCAAKQAVSDICHTKGGYSRHTSSICFLSGQQWSSIFMSADGVGHMRMCSGWLAKLRHRKSFMQRHQATTLH